jgi:hypothetical protein
MLDIVDFNSLCSALFGGACAFAGVKADIKYIKLVLGDLRKRVTVLESKKAA